LPQPKQRIVGPHCPHSVDDTIETRVAQDADAVGSNAKKLESGTILH
jgi:hypothetical protein